MQSKVPDLRQRVQDEHTAICELDEGVNQVKKAPIVVYLIGRRVAHD